MARNNLTQLVKSAFPVCPHEPSHVPPPLAPPTRGGEALGMARFSSPHAAEVLALRVDGQGCVGVVVWIL